MSGMFALEWAVARSFSTLRFMCATASLPSYNPPTTNMLVSAIHPSQFHTSSLMSVSLWWSSRDLPSFLTCVQSRENTQLVNRMWPTPDRVVAWKVTPWETVLYNGAYQDGYTRSNTCHWNFTDLGSTNLQPTCWCRLLTLHNFAHLMKVSLCWVIVYCCTSNEETHTQHNLSLEV